ncbi:hypothetical protein Pla52o_52470 [Novipirellula galeiformis]|uniref:Putative Flp pilus-assembly TadG-like N-terminal domain-containing protein n=1 Tax=Novipirellula galeiformis TaxID=2528004 RepID=A0A5C6BYT3_9BACT|nr:pilus assembly protein TadG-related protein [Novipirellula galeiformis]TWU17443.1 hypothetical protein Pla52o_52470 [Novipirellula galeiformis]
MQSQNQKSQRSNSNGRNGKILILLAVLLPTLMLVTALVVDGSSLIGKHRRLQHTADAIALSAAAEFVRTGSATAAIASGYTLAHQVCDTDSVDVEIHSPPEDGPHAGQRGAVSVRLAQRSNLHLAAFVATSVDDIRTSATARATPAQHPNALVALASRHPRVSILGLPTLLGSSLSLAALEVEGIGSLEVHGAIHVNSQYGRVDENNQRVGRTILPPYGMMVTPGLGLAKVKAKEIRVVGGVDSPIHYRALDGSPTALRANRFPIRDPYDDLPTPPVASGPSRGGVTVVGLPLIGPPVTLYPGTYDWIQVVSGIVTFKPGVYVIKGKHPLTQQALALLAGRVTAKNVMFYIGDPANASSGSGTGDLLDVLEPLVGDVDVVPSVIIAEAVSRLSMSGIQDPASPFHQLLIYQGREQRNAIVIEANDLLKTCELSGSIYAKRGHLLFAGRGNYDLSVVAGTMRFLAVGKTTLQPQHLLPPAEDVYLVE